MTVEAPDLETEERISNVGRDVGSDEAARGGYTTGGEVSALTLIEDVRAIRQRLDGIEVALRGLGGRIEELSPGKAEGAASDAPPGSLEELRKALLGDLQTDLRHNAKRSTLLMGAMFLTMLLGLGGLGWMVRQMSVAVAALE